MKLKANEFISFSICLILFMAILANFLVYFSRMYTDTDDSEDYKEPVYLNKY